MLLDILEQEPPASSADSSSTPEAANNDSFSLHMSTLIAEFCSRNDLDAEMFQKLTDPKLLPRLDFEACKKLSDLEDKIVGKTRKRSSNGSKLSNLQ
jgi:hypothetical protein